MESDSPYHIFYQFHVLETQQSLKIYRAAP